MDLILAPFAALLAFSFLELVLFGGWIIMMVLATASDRRGYIAPKWGVTLVGLILFAIFADIDWKFTTIYDNVTTMSFWQPVAVFLAIGLAYSGVEFVLQTRRSAAYAKKRWADFLTSKLSVPSDTMPLKKVPAEQLLQQARLSDAPEELKDFVRKELNEFAAGIKSRYGVYGSGESAHAQFIAYRVGSELDIQPVVDRPELARHIGAWSFFWPAYAISMIFGDLLQHIWELVADVFAKLSSQMIKVLFRDAFKL